MLAISIRVFNAFVIFLMVSTMAVLAQTSDTLQRARGLLDHGQAAEAAHTLETFLQRDPGSADAWTLLGEVRVQQNEAAKAEECFHKALAIQPNLTLAQTNLGHLLLDEHRQSEAFPYLAEALGSDRGNVQLRRNAGQCCRRNRAPAACRRRPERRACDASLRKGRSSSELSSSAGPEHP